MASRVKSGGEVLHYSASSMSPYGDEVQGTPQKILHQADTKHRREKFVDCGDELKSDHVEKPMRDLHRKVLALKSWRRS